MSPSQYEKVIEQQEEKIKNLEALVDILEGKLYDANQMIEEE